MNRINIEAVSVEKMRKSKVDVEGQMLGDVSVEVLIQKALEHVVGVNRGPQMQQLQVVVMEDEDE